MNALTLSGLGCNFADCAIRRVLVPAPAAGEVLVRVRAAAVNFVDLLVTRGRYQKKPDLPFILGSDVAGDIVALGEGAAGFELGQAVMGMRFGGAFAEYTVFSADQLKSKPALFSYEEAAAFGAAYYTAYVALTRRARLQSGEWLLVLGATGGVGLAAVDLGKQLGANVIAASGSVAKLKVIQEEYDVDAVIDLSTPFYEKVRQITGGGANVILDPVGGDTFDESLRCVAFDGRLLVVGFASGRIPQVKTNVPLIKGFSILGVRAGEFGRRFPEKGAADRAHLWDMASEGSVRPRIHAAFPINQWRDAFEAVQSRQVVGRVVINPETAS